MVEINKIPIVVGVTGHRNIVEDDKPSIKKLVEKSLVEIRELCKDTPVIMLNALAQGSDMLCAEAAFELGIDVYALLPCPKEQYILSFDNEMDKNKLYDYLAKAKRTIIAPDVEKNKAWLKRKIDIDDDSYRYRQLGIYMAEHSHVLIALWDGKPPKVQYGCGTVEVIKFALEHNFLDKDHMFKPGIINDSAVVWIKSRKRGDEEQDIVKTWMISNRAKLDSKELSGYKESEHTAECSETDDYTFSQEPPQFLKDLIKKTRKYNEEICSISEDQLKHKLWVENPSGDTITDDESDARKLDAYRKSLRYHYAKADELSFNGNQKFYKRFLRVLAILGAFVALFFLLYDDASIPYLIFPCTALIGSALVLQRVGKHKEYHRKYIEYRTFAEALRIQFYLSMCLNEDEINTNVCDLCAWAQKVNIVWIDKALQALAVVHPAVRLKVKKDGIIYVWLAKVKSQGNPEGQRSYQNRKKLINQREAKKFDRATAVCQLATLLVYLGILVLEIITCVLNAYGRTCFWENMFVWHISWRNFGAIILGVLTAITLLFSSYWGKLSYARQADDNEKMLHFYSSVYARWEEVRNHSAEEIKKFVTEIAREEIVENGNWCSYVNENRLEINI